MASLKAQFEVNVRSERGKDLWKSLRSPAIFGIRKFAEFSPLFYPSKTRSTGS